MSKQTKKVNILSSPYYGIPAAIETTVSNISSLVTTYKVMKVLSQGVKR